MRLFLAIYPPKEFRDYFRDVMRGLDKEKRNMRFTELEEIHMTLRFLGAKVSQGSKDKIVKALMEHAGTYPKPMVELGDLSLGFARQHNPRVLFSNVKENPELHQLVDNLHRVIRSEKRMDTIQWKQKEDRHFHMTMGRLKDSATRSTGRDVKELIKKIDLPMPEAFQAEEVYLVQSEIQRNKRPKYRRLERIKL